MEIITGYTGVGHVTSAQAGATNTMLYGSVKAILDVGNTFDAEIVDNNHVQIADGYGINQGRFFCNQEPETVVIGTGTADTKREDLIVARYTKEELTGVESITFKVIAGTPGADYVTPSYINGNILNGDSIDEMVLYKVHIDGIDIDEIIRVASVVDSVNAKVDAVVNTIDETAEALVTPYIAQAEAAATNAEAQVTAATAQAELAHGYAEEAKSFTPSGYEALVGDVAQNKSDISQNTSDISQNTSDISQNTSDISTLNSNLKASDDLVFRFATDGEGNYGYLKADDSFTPFKSGGGEAHFAIIYCNNEVLDLVGTTVTLTKPDGDTETATVKEDGTCSFNAYDVGDYTITYNTSKTKVVSVSQNDLFNNTVKEVRIAILKIVTFANGTDVEIIAMIDAHYNNEINISDYWSVGDTRSVNLSAMGNSGIANQYNVIETHTAQTAEVVIIGFEHDNLETPINGHTKAAITLNQKNCMKLENNTNYMYESAYDTSIGSMNNYIGTHTNVGGWTNCDRRIWCNSVYKNALPATLKNAIKTVNKLTSAGSRSSVINTTNDDIFLLSEIEVYGTNTYTSPGEGSQYDYFSLSDSNKYKEPIWEAGQYHYSAIWWLRSPCSSNTTEFCIVFYKGNLIVEGSGYARGVAPAFCL